MALSRIFSPVLHFDDDRGNPLAGGWLCTYISNTDTPVATYKDPSGTLNDVEIELDGRGECEVWLDSSIVYKFVLWNADKTKWFWKKNYITAGVSGGSPSPSINFNVVGDESTIDVEERSVGDFKVYVVSVKQEIIDILNNKKTTQTPVTDPSASGAGLEFIDSITQDANGEITPHKKTVQDGTTSQKGVVQLNNAIDSTSTTEAATPKAVKDAYDELNNKIVARAVFLSQQEWAAQSLLPGDPAKVYYVEDGTGEDAYTVYVWKSSTSEYVEVDESSIDLDGYWHDGPTTTGNGNVVTNITLGNDGVPQVEKGITALTQHQDISGKLDTTGDASNTTATFTKASGDTSSMTSGSKLSVIFTAISSLFGSLKALAFKDKVSDSDISGTISDNHIASASTWNGKQDSLGINSSSGDTGKFLNQKGGWTTPTDTKVNVTAKSDNEQYKLLAAMNAAGSGTNNTDAVYDADVALNPSTNTISANVSGTAGTLKGTYSGSGGQLTPSNVVDGTVRAAMMNNPKGLTLFGGNYCDCILLSTYTGNDVPVITGFGIARASGTPKAYIFNGTQGSSTGWSNGSRVVTASGTSQIGAPTTPVYVKADGSVYECTPSSMSVGSADTARGLYYSPIYGLKGWRRILNVDFTNVTNNPLYWGYTIVWDIYSDNYQSNRGYLGRLVCEISNYGTFSPKIPSKAELYWAIKADVNDAAYRPNIVVSDGHVEVYLYHSIDNDYYVSVFKVYEHANWNPTQPDTTISSQYYNDADYATYITGKSVSVPSVAVMRVQNANYATKIGTSSSHPQIGSSTTPVYVDSNGQVQACNVLSGGTSNFNRVFTKSYTVSSTDQYITTLIKNDNNDLIADYVAWHNANYGKLSSPPMIIISVFTRDTDVSNPGLIELSMHRTGNGCNVFGEQYTYMGNQHGSRAYNTQYFTDQTFVSGAAYYLNIRNETPNTMWTAGTILDISIRIVAHAVSVT